MANRIRVEPTQAGQLFALIVSLHAMAAFAVFHIDFQWGHGFQSGPLTGVTRHHLIAILLCLLGVSLCWQWQRHCAVGSSRWIKSFGFDGEAWWLETRDELHFAQLQADSVVNGWIIVLHFRLTTATVASRTGRRSLVLFNRSADANALRRLRVMLRLQAATVLNDNAASVR